MSTTIDQQVVEMRFDNKHFEDNVQTSLGTLEKLKRSLKLDGVAKGIEEVNNAYKRFDMSGLSGAVSTVTNRFSALQVMGVTALANITNSAVNAGKRIASALTIDPIKTGFKEYETQMNAVQTILANTESKGSTLQDVNRALDELNTYADKTIYNFTEMTRNIGTFTAAGVDLNTSVSAIKGIANLAAVSGSTSQQASNAMYQLSQALSSGTVKLMDWNSVVNAGMGGQVFQDALKETAKVHGIAIDKMIERDGSFRETLQTGWLSADILTETLNNFTMAAEEGSEEWRIYKEELMDKGYAEEQAVAILKMANTATDAATKVKTFTQLWDTLQESAQSGWTKSWQLIIGDFGEAKEFLTDVSNKIGGMIEASSDARNSLLEGGLSSGWKQLLGKGIADEEGFKDTIKAVVKDVNKNDAFDELIKKAEEAGGSFDDALSEGLKNGAVTADMLTESVHKLSDKMTSMSAKELKAAGYTAEHVSKIKDLSDGFKEGTISMDEFVMKMTRSSGRENLIQALWNAFDGLLEVLAPVREAFEEIFPPATGEQLYALTEAILRFSEKLTISDDAAGKLKRTFKGVFALLDIGVQVIKAIARGVGNLLGYIMPTGGGLLDFTAKVGDFIVGLSEGAKASDMFGKAVGKVTDVIKIVLGGIGQFAGSIAEAFGSVTNIDTSGFDSFIDGVKARLEPLTAIGEGIKKFFMGIVGVAKKVAPVFTALLNVVGKVFFGLTDALVEMIQNANFDKLFDIFNGGVFAAIGIGIARFVNGPSGIFSGIKDIVDEAGGFVEGLKDILGGVSDALGAFTQSLKAETLKKLATAIAILAAALLVISLIDSEKLMESLGAVTVLFGDLMGAMYLFGKIGGVDKDAIKSTTVMIGMSVAILILAGAMKTLSSLDWEGVGKGLVGIAGLAAVIVLATKAMSSDKGKLIKGATSLVVFALAIKVLASVCRDLSTLNWEELGKGLLGVGVLLGSVALFLKVAKFEGKAMSTAVGILVLSAALKVMASVCADFGSMSWESIGKGLVGIGALLLEISLFTKLTGNAQHVMSTATALVLIGAAMKILASAVSDMGSMSWESICKGLLTMAGALVAIVMAINLMPTNMLSTSIGLIGISAALLIINNVLSSMGSMSWESIGKGLATLAGALVIIAISMKLMKDAILGAAALVIVTESLLFLVPVLKTLGSMSWESIGKGLATLAGAFAILGIGSLLLKPLVGTLIAVSGTLAAFSLSCVALGVGLTLVGIGLGFIATSLVMLGGSITLFVAEILAVFPVILKLIGSFIVAFCEAIADSSVAICDAVAVIVIAIVRALVDSVPVLVDGVLVLLNSILKSLVEYTPSIVSALFDLVIGIINALAAKLPELITACVNLLMSLFQGVVDALKEIDPKALLDGIIAIGILSAIVAALAAIAGMIPAAMIGVLGLGAIMLELAVVIAAIGEIARKFDGLKGLIEDGGDIMQAIGTAIGQFIGGILGGIAEGATSTLPRVGQNLSDFMNNAKDFIDGVSSMDASVINGTMTLVEAILALTAANVVDNITSWLSGGNSIDKFGEKIAAFGGYIKDFADTVDGINSDTVTAAANATKVLALATKNIPSNESGIAQFGKDIKPLGRGLKNFGDEVKNIDADSIKTAAEAAEALAKMTDTIPNEGGVAGWFAGENSVSKFSKDLKDLGKGLKNFADETSGVDNEAVISAAGAAEALAKMTGIIPNEGGVASWFAGDNSISKFGTDLKNLGVGLKDFATEVDGLNVESMASATDAAEAIVRMSKSIPNEGGMVAWFTGDNSISKFGTDLKTLGVGLKDFATEVDGVDPEAIVAAAGAAEAIADLTTHIPNSDGVAQWFTGEKSLSKFGGDLETLGTGLKDFATEVDGINTESMTSAAKAAEAIADLTTHIPNSDGVAQWFTGEKSLSKFGGQLKALGTGLKDFSTEVSGIEQSPVDTAVSAAHKISDLVSVVPSSEGMAQWFTGEKSVSKFGGQLKALGTGLKDFATEVDGIDDAAMGTAASAAAQLSSLVAVVPETDGLAKWFTGEKSISKFGTDLKNLGTGLKDFATEVSGIEDIEGAKSAVSVASSLAELSKNVPEGQSGWNSLFGGTTSLEQFSNDLKLFGGALAAFSESVSPIKNTSTMSSVVDSAKTVADFVKTLTKDGISLMSSFGSGLATLGSSMKNFYSHLSTVSTENILSAWSAFDRLRGMANKLSTDDISRISSMASALSGVLNVLLSCKMVDANAAQRFADAVDELGRANLDKLYNGLTDPVILNKIRIAGETALDKFVEGITFEGELAKESFQQVVEACSDLPESTYSTFYDAALNAVRGFANGISANMYMATAQARAMAIAAAEAARVALDEHSPSRVFDKIGDFAGVAFVNALGRYVDKAAMAGEDLAGSATNTLNRAISKIAEVVDSDIDIQPTIRPVLDLSDVESGASAISQMLSGSRSIAVDGAAIGAASALMSRYSNDRGSNDLLSAINDLRKDITGMSRDTYNINGVTYDDGSNISEAVQTIIRAAKIERRT